MFRAVVLDEKCAGMEENPYMVDLGDAYLGPEIRVCGQVLGDGEGNVIGGRGAGGDRRMGLVRQVVLVGLMVGVFLLLLPRTKFGSRVMLGREGGVGFEK